MLQNASYSFFFNETKQNKATKKKGKKSPPAGIAFFAAGDVPPRETSSAAKSEEKRMLSQATAGVEPETFKVEGQRILHCATLPYVKLAVFNIFVPTRQIIQDGEENANVRRKELHRNPN